MIRRRTTPTLALALALASCGPTDSGPVDVDPSFATTLGGTVTRLVGATNDGDGTGTLLLIDAADGSGAAIAKLTYPGVSLAYNPADGLLYGSFTFGPPGGARSLLSLVDPVSGALTPLGTVEDPGDPSRQLLVTAMGFHEGVLFGLGPADVLLRIDHTTAAATDLGGVGHDLGNMGGAVVGGTFYVVARNRSASPAVDMSLYSIALPAAGATRIGSTGIADFRGVGVAASPGGGLLAVVDATLHSVDASTASASAIGGTGFSSVSSLELIDYGERVDSACPCAGPAGGSWKNHGQYMACVVDETGDLWKSGQLTQGERQQLRTGAARSGCGK